MLIDSDEVAVAKINLRGAQVLCADNSSHGLEIMDQILSAFGVVNITRCASAKEFQDAVDRAKFDLILIDASMGEMTGYDLIRELRRKDAELNRFASTILVSGYTPLSRVEEARDCGASYVIAKPIDPEVLVRRILWLSKIDRVFVDSEGYVGPDRRFRHSGVPDGLDGRRSDDLPPELGPQASENLSQSEVDKIFVPQKVSL